MNTNFLNLRAWLVARSVSTESTSREEVFKHKTGEVSILVLRGVRTDPLIDVTLEPLASFYRQYSGASIGDTQILLGTNVIGGVVLPDGLILPDLNAMTKRARELEIAIGEGELVFMVEAAWNFVFTIAGDSKRQSTLRKYDRDFGKTHLVQDLDEVIDSWWQIVEADL